MATNNSIDSNIPIEIVLGGTNAASMATNFGTVIFDGSSLVALASAGTIGQALTSNGAGSAPSFQNFTPGSGITTSAFLAHKLSSTTLTHAIATPIPYGSEDFDVGNNYITQVFTAPESGYYMASSNLLIAGQSSGASCFQGWAVAGTSDPLLMGAVITREYQGIPGVSEQPAAGTPFTGFVSKPANRMFHLDSGDELVVYAAWFSSVGTGGSTANANATATFASIYLIGQ